MCYDVGIDITSDVDADVGIDVEPYDMCTNITTSMTMFVPTLLTTWYVMVYDIEETYDIKGFRCRSRGGYDIVALSANVDAYVTILRYR